MEERLQKFMASCGVASRRKCEELILAGKVKVNGILVSEVGIKIDPTKDLVEYEGKVISKEENKVYIMLNKPEGYISSVKDEKGRPTILDIVKVKERIYPIGRLDYDSSGLLLLTNDGEIYNKIIHPRVELKKKYIAVVQGEISEKDINKFEIGIDIGGYITAPAELKILSYEKDLSTVEISIHEGKNRQIRKMCAALNHEVLSLKRIAIGDIKLGYLKRGEFRILNENEVEYLNSL
ncbi:pseudouridine synthase [Clostridium saccharoperbutylacetonicum]|uniref:Pseudouridine synthase n=1 Tax=Clostridium saccharoperbutylacetonicum N1-4(HMT) TaxID=931276 RepID=M1MJW8_9CLOT|nr:pseudouridine synthase [Clostridium saccharoperbutylacetonicum]AGF56603.1 ribosomal large subunit pseudouridine synthase B [Clostridium saccharoperbutylacetonicum N1-4(HMT)]AQR95277.1 ribosomal large subunit pseudouridine synthase B [Clostridium saccharoperbutylacetonicum]NRT62646.1 23S rRNA pseudouridine2605 synthase [Clostridium saccharoperbutylacetonicum]NSB25994.1 23S rRNA pseudouridine2605 synthase [Clostridium saccharoperbutylacetonicum]NSB31132.1 23S rRNA pseudouridine2605 synthase [